VAVATPCWPAPVSAITRRLPIRSGEQRLAQHVVDLVGAGVVEVLALEQDPHPQLARRAGWHSVEPGGPAGVVVEQAVELGPEPVVGPGAPERDVELLRTHGISVSGTNRPPNSPK
jgi:hypothetical protein